jgi:hypothetical protein
MRQDTLFRMSRPAKPALSKSRYLAGLQCPKRLWTEVHARHLIPPVDPSTEARFAEGHEVGELATQLYPGGLAIDPGTLRWDRVVAETSKALSQRRPLYEAAFRHGGAACRVDILVPAPSDQWDVLEVKSSTRVKEVHLRDLALQGYVLEGSGIGVRDYYLVHLDRSYVRHGDLDVEALFSQVLVTDQVGERMPSIAGELAVMQAVLRQGSSPEIAIGRHCEEPYECPLMGRCWSFLPEPSVLDLTGDRRKGFEYLSQGFVGLGEVSDASGLSNKQRIQIATVRSEKPHVDRSALADFLAALVYPAYFFDIETFAPAVPRFDASRSYQQIPFLFSVHRVNEPGQAPEHFVYVHGSGGDPRPQLLRAVRASLGMRGSVVAYNASFERRVLRESAAVLGSEWEQWTARLEERFVDLLIPFRDFAYHHPEQVGKASLKAVLTPLTGMSYTDLEIADGESASREYAKIVSGEVEGLEKARSLRQLAEYCALDTLAMVAIVDRLHALVSGGPDGGDEV